MTLLEELDKMIIDIDKNIQESTMTREVLMQVSDGHAYRQELGRANTLCDIKRRLQQIIDKHNSRTIILTNKVVHHEEEFATWKQLAERLFEDYGSGDTRDYDLKEVYDSDDKKT